MDSICEEKEKESAPLSEYSNFTDAASDSSYSESSSSQSIDAEWASHIENDGSLLYVESYITSTVKEKQASLALKAATSDEKTFSSPTKSIKHHTKLLNLLKRRPSVRLRSSDSTKNAPSSIVTDSSTLKVTFRDNPSGEARRVVLKVTEYGNNYGRRASLCETVLGIMPGKFSEAPDSRVMVAGLAPGSTALKDGIIKIGDWLKEVDGKIITWENLDNLLLDIKIPTTVVLQVQKCASETLAHEDVTSEKRITQTQLVKLISGKGNLHQEYYSKVECRDMPRHTVLYLSLQGVTEDSSDKEDIKYQFPSEINKLVQVRGMFITTAHSLQEVVGTPVLSSTVILEGEYYNVAFCREENDVFLITLPESSVTRSDIIVLMNQISKLIVYEFGSLSNAFSNPFNKIHLDHLFLLLFEDIFLQIGKLRVLPSLQENESLYIASSPTVADLIGWNSSCLFSVPSWLILKDEEAKVLIETCLNELESGDFGEDESDCEDCQLLYNILGCCIFYKGHLVNSHLDYESLQNVFLFLHHHKLLQLTKKEALSQMILWKIVYPKQEDLLPTSGNVMHYLLVVAMNHILLAMLVESGNVTELMDEKAGPDIFLIDQAETTLYHLHSMHVHAACEESLISDSIETVCLDSKLNISTTPKKAKQKNIDNSDGLRTPDVPSILKQRSHSESPHPLHLQEFPPCNCDRSSGDGTEDCPSPLCSKDSSFALPDADDDDGEEEEKENNSSDSDFRIWKGSENRSGYVYSPEVGSICPKGDPSPPLKITVGSESVLLHFLQLDVGDGVFVTPSSNSLNPALVPIHSELLYNFYVTCSHIRHVLHTGLRNKITNSNYSGVPVMNNIKEYGIMFECTPPLNTAKKKPQNLYYWVIGRIYGAPYEREIYVAIEDSIPQNIQEIAFKIALGLS